MKQIEWLKDFSSFELSVTSYCQANCPLCARTDRETGKLKSFIPLQHVKWEKLLKLIRDVAHYSNVRKIQICGDYGDPLMHPDIEKIIAEINLYGLLASLHTNGGLRDASFYERLAEEADIIIIFAIDGMDEPTNSKYRIGVNFDKAMENMLLFAKLTSHLRQKSQWDFLVFDYNYHQMDDALKLAKDNGIGLNFRINKRDWEHSITDQGLIREINQKYKGYML